MNRITPFWHDDRRYRRQGIARALQHVDNMARVLGIAPAGFGDVHLTSDCPFELWALDNKAKQMLLMDHQDRK